MTKSIIYRLEHKETGEGIFSSGAVAMIKYQLSEEGIEGPDPYRHPPPGEDPELKEWWGELSWDESSKYYFGFRSLDALYAWFDCPIFRQRLSEAGIVLVTYEVRNLVGKRLGAVHGTAQSVFLKDFAMILNISEIN